jgi:hypothetical protein
MRPIRTLLATVTALLALAPAALAHTTAVGNSSGSPAMNVCVASISCTYVNYSNGKATDVVRHTGKLVDWALNAGSVGGQVQLRILRPVGGGHFKLIHSSAIETVGVAGPNSFGASINVRRGDVLALSNDTSGIYMASAPAGTCVRYFQGAISGAPTQNVPMLHLELSADVKY